MLRIHRTDIVYEIRSTPAKLSISQPKADFELKQKHAKVQAKTEPMQIEIDQTQCFNEAGLKNITALAEEMVSKSQQAVAEGIDRRVSEGNQMAAIEYGGNAFAEIAAANSIQLFDFNVDFIPKSRPIINFKGGRVDISVDEGYVELKSKPNKPIIDVQLGDVDIIIKQHPEIKFEYVGKELDKKL